MAWLLAESFAESMLLPSGYVFVLGYLVKQYLFERMELLPNTATLFLAGTVEVCFNKKGAVASLPTPTPPKNSPYISNMAMKKSLRRRGIGWHLLKASEELILQMSSSREVYLHCMMIDTSPFNMYKKARYDIVKTDTILVLLLLRRRKHLICKKLTCSCCHNLFCGFVLINHYAVNLILFPSLSIVKKTRNFVSSLSSSNGLVLYCYAEINTFERERNNSESGLYFFLLLIYFMSVLSDRECSY
ncbi:hypothetical protein D8674_029244 [Pyrus ussuriensis x Pyrus communis]|uniref:N-acetyltransferase domain-containing protein n=1 Tax=Pyrus ussuriensis x Pyrus communis TaxID=2448454 RepID=A0A5N5I1I0_9ROSA|nr:hypothetical protein D8674_029244 [Pyrus ussuriensis x Pyrus communis]